LALFEDVTQFGWVTENRYRPEGCAAGFYPVITIPQVHYKESMCGYATLMALSVEDARAMTDEGIQLHIKWVGAEVGGLHRQAAAPRGATHEEDQASKKLQSSVLFAATDRDTMGRGD
jgi:hypothetical protein